MAPATLPASFSPSPVLISPTPSSLHSAVNNLLSLPTASLSLRGYIAPLLPLRRSPRIPRCTTSSTSPSISNATSVLFSQELGLDEREVECLLQKHPELELASPESLHRRLLSLQSVGITGLALDRTVTRRPETLTSPEVGRFLHFVHEDLKGLEPAKLERLLVSSHPQFFPAFRAKVRLLVDHGMPGDELGQILSNVSILKVFGERPSKSWRR